jgi:hypothetical protein
MVFLKMIVFGEMVSLSDGYVTFSLIIKLAATRTPEDDFISKCSFYLILTVFLEER